MKRLLFNSTVVVSLLLCVAGSILWVRGHYASDTIYFESTRNDEKTYETIESSLFSDRDGLGAYLFHFGPKSYDVAIKEQNVLHRPTSPRLTRFVNYDQRWLTSSGSNPTFANRLGFVFDYNWYQGSYSFKLGFPTGLVIALTLIAPSIWLRRRIRSRRENRQQGFEVV